MMMTSTTRGDEIGGGGGGSGDGNGEDEVDYRGLFDLYDAEHAGWIDAQRFVTFTRDSMSDNVLWSDAMANSFEELSSLLDPHDTGKIYYEQFVAGIKFLTGDHSHQQQQLQEQQRRRSSALEYSTHSDRVFNHNDANEENDNDDDDDDDENIDDERSEYGNISLDLTNSLEPNGNNVNHQQQQQQGAGKMHTSSPKVRSSTLSSIGSTSTATIKQIANDLYATTSALTSSHSTSSMSMLPSSSSLLSSSSTATTAAGNATNGSLGGGEQMLMASNSSSNLSGTGGGGMNNWSQQHGQQVAFEHEQIVHELERRVADLTNQVAYTSEENGELVAKLNHANGDNAHLIDRIRDMEESLMETERRMQQCVDEQQQTHADAVAKLNKQWDNERYQLHSQMSELDKEVNTWKREHAALNKELLERQHKLDFAEEKLLEEIEANSRLQRDAGELVRECERTQSELDEANARLEQLERDSEALKARLDDQHSNGSQFRLRGISMSFDEVASRLTELEFELRHQKNANAVLESQLMMRGGGGASGLAASSASAGVSLAAEMSIMSKDEIMEKLLNEQQISKRLREYLESMLAKIMLHCPQLLEVAEMADGGATSTPRTTRLPSQSSSLDTSTSSSPSHHADTPQTIDHPLADKNTTSTPTAASTSKSKSQRAFPSVIHFRKSNDKLKMQI